MWEKIKYLICIDMFKGVQTAMPYTPAGVVSKMHSPSDPLHPSCGGVEKTGRNMSILQCSLDSDYVS